MAETKVTINGETDGGGAWTAWTPTITASTGAFTTVSGSGKYKVIGKTCHFIVNITITTVGTATGTVFTLPVTAKDGVGNVGSCREDAVVGYLGNVRLNATTTATLAKYDNNSFVGNGYLIRGSGTYEVA